MDGVALVHPLYYIADFDLHGIGHVFRWCVEHLYLHGLRRECWHRDTQCQRTGEEQPPAEQLSLFHNPYIPSSASRHCLCYRCSSLERRSWTLNRARRFQVRARISLFQFFRIDSERVRSEEHTSELQS